MTLHTRIRSLLLWYDSQQRTLPWRAASTDAKPANHINAYHVWLSEIMLQQTTVATVIPYFQLFINRYPTICALAQASLEEILRDWSGLGYYSRARNLHLCAQKITQDYAGAFPQDFKSLCQLPGVGPYTAAAILNIVFCQATPVMDGNIKRIVSRLEAIEIAFPKADELVLTYMEQFICKKRPGDFIQALMDLGATICKPKTPHCSQCPLTASCLAYQRGCATLYPKKEVKKPRPQHRGSAYIIQQADKIFLQKRPGQGLLAGLYEVPNQYSLSEQAKKLDPPYKGEWEHIGEVTHIFTHFSLKLTVYRNFEPPLSLQSEGLWCVKEQLNQLALSTLMKKVLSLNN